MVSRLNITSATLTVYPDVVLEIHLKTIYNIGCHMYKAGKQLSWNHLHLTQSNNNGDGSLMQRNGIASAHTMRLKFACLL